MVEEQQKSLEERKVEALESLAKSAEKSSNSLSGIETGVSWACVWAFCIAVGSCGTEDVRIENAPSFSSRVADRLLAPNP